MSFTAYKAGLAEGGGHTRVVITLEIPHDAITNIGRKDIVNKQTATYRTNKAIVRKITDIWGTSYQTAYSLYKKKIAYNVGELVEEPEFDKNIDTVCATGIHFFLNKECAELYQMCKNNGVFRAWYKNGQLKYERNFENRTLHGVNKAWYENGQQHFIEHYNDGYLHGNVKDWYENGKLKRDCNYKNGILQRNMKEWSEDGKLISECNYENDENDENAEKDNNWYKRVMHYLL